MDSTKNTLHEVYAALWIILALNDHLLRRHLLSPSIAYYAVTYGNRDNLKQLRRSLQNICVALRKAVSQEARRVIQEYAARWDVQLQP